MEDHLKSFVCPEPACSQRFTSEDDLNAHFDSYHYVQHLLAGLPNVDQTPTPTKFLKSCEEVGLFQEINPFDKDFKTAVEQQQSEASVEDDEVAVDVTSAHIQLHDSSSTEVVEDTNVSSSNTEHPSHVLVYSSIAASTTVSMQQLASPSAPAVDLTITHLPLNESPASRSVDSPQSHGADVGNISIQLLLTLPSGETLPCHIPASVVVLPDRVSPSSGAASCLNAVSPVQLLPNSVALHGMTHYSSLESNPPSFNSGLPLIVQSSVVSESSDAAADTQGQPAATFAAPQNGLKPVGIAAATQQKLKATVETRTRLANVSTTDGHVSGQQSLPSPVQSHQIVPVSVAPPLLSGDSQTVHSTRLQIPSSSSMLYDDESYRRRQFLESNRAAASRCRRKRKHWIVGLENKVAEQEKVNVALESEARSLKQEIYELKLLLLEHKDCPAMTANVSAYNDLFASSDHT